MNRALLFWVAVLMMFAGGATLWLAWKSVGSQETATGQSSDAGIEFPPKGVGIGEFELTETSGKTFNSSDLTGKVWVASFFFASCPQSCRRQNEIVKTLQDEFGGRGVKLLSITVDPETDTPEKLRDYAASLQADEEQWYFLTGDMQYIRRLGYETFNLPVEKRAHADRLIAVDRKGEIRGIYNWHEPKELAALKKKLNSLLEESAATEGKTADG